MRRQAAGGVEAVWSVSDAAALRWLLSQSNDHLHYLLQLPPVLQITRIIYKVLVECGRGEREGRGGRKKKWRNCRGDEFVVAALMS